MNILTNVNTLSRGIGSLTTLYSAYQIGKIGTQVAKSKHKSKALQNNLVPLIHASLGLSLGSIGAGLADLSLASGGALHLISQAVTNKFYKYQSEQRQQEMSEFQKQYTASSGVMGCCAYIIDDAVKENDKGLKDNIEARKQEIRFKLYEDHLSNMLEKDIESSKIPTKNQANEVFNLIKQKKDLTQEQKNIYHSIEKIIPETKIVIPITSKELQSIKKGGELEMGNAPLIINGGKSVPFTGKIKDIFENGKTDSLKNVTLSVNTKNHDGQSTKELKIGDTLHEGMIIKEGEKYQIWIDPIHAIDPYKNNALENMENKENHFQWDLSTILATASLATLIGIVAFGTPMLVNEMKLDTLSSLGKAIKWGGLFSGMLMPCGVNAANMHGHIGYYLSKEKNITIKTPDLLDKLGAMKIGETDGDYHFLVDFNGTLTKGSEFSALKTSSNSSVDDAQLRKILEPIVALGVANKTTHHIHQALKNKVESLSDSGTPFNEESFKDGKIENLEGYGIYYHDDNKHYAIGNKELIEKFLAKLSESNKDEVENIKTRFEELKEQKFENSVTYIINNDKIYALETKPKLRDDAKAFLTKHEGKFTVLTGAILPDDVKKELGLDGTNYRGNLIPDNKKKYAENLQVDGRLMPKEKIVAFGDGGNDWGMFHTVNVATQLTDINDKPHKGETNFAKVFSDVVIPELSDFDVLNNIAKAQKNPQMVLNGLGLASMAWGASMALSHVHHHNPFHHTLHHLGSILGFYALSSLGASYLVGSTKA